ncbi:MAG: hypothetical protein FWC22_04735 [Treponema sp.]|nr:hypothetical protein [Treponema sp.]
MRKFFILLVFLPVFAFAEPMYSPKWGFFIDFPEGYEFVDGDGMDRFSFNGPQGLMVDLVVYNGRFNSLLELVNDVNGKLSNKGDADFFKYRGRQAAIIRLEFAEYAGWGIIAELNSPNDIKPMLLALAYGPASKEELELFSLSALDSICPTEGARRYPGIITEYSFPRGEQKKVMLAVNGLSAAVYENDAEAAQVVIEREFAILEAYLNTPLLQDACIRYYRFIYRDSYDRISDALSVISGSFGAEAGMTDGQKRQFAQKALSFVQGFNYERNLKSSDFLNLVTAVTEGRGDCDSRSLLFALLLANANIRSSIMLSHHYSHAMALADIAGSGARFEALGTKWLVAETTAKIDIGLIDQEISDSRYWFAVVLEE